MYHYVRKPSVELPCLKFLHAEDFCRQLDYFEEQFGIANAQDFTAFVNGQQAFSNKVVLTFDDGLKDHYQFVYPELVRRGITAFFYVSTGVFGSTRLLAVHRLHILLGKYGGEAVYNSMNRYLDDSMINAAHAEKFKSNTYQTQDNDWYSSEVKRIFNYYIHYNRQNEVLDKLMDEYFTDEPLIANNFYVDKNEIAEMCAAGMIFGSHTVHHYLLSKCSAALQQEEIVNSFAQIQRISGGEGIKTFCYPYGGGQSYTNDTVDILRSADVDFAFSVKRKILIRMH